MFLQLLFLLDFIFIDLPRDILNTSIITALNYLVKIALFLLSERWHEGFRAQKWIFQRSVLNIEQLCISITSYSVRQHFSWDSKISFPTQGMDAVFIEWTVLQVAISKSEMICFMTSYFPIFLDLNLMLFFFLHIDLQRYIILQLLAWELPKSQVHQFLPTELWLYFLRDFSSHPLLTPILRLHFQSLFPLLDIALSMAREILTLSSQNMWVLYVLSTYLIKKMFVIQDFFLMSTNLPL